VSRVKKEENSNDVIEFSFRRFILISIAILLFAFYLKAILFGENSLSILEKVQDKKRQLLQEKYRLQRDNQRLQKRYFELLQVVGESS